MVGRKVIRFCLAAAVAMVLPAALCGTARASGGAKDDEPDVAETRAAVVAALKERESRLRNIRYKVREAVTLIDLDTGTRETLSESLIEFRWCESGHWMHLRKYAADKSLKNEHFTNWADGRARSLDFRPGRPTPGGVILAEENTNFGYRAINQVLGLRMLKDGEAQSVRAR